MKGLHFYAFTISIFSPLLLIFYFSSCQSDNESRVNGFWKLTSIELPNKTQLPIDSQFYAFQGENIFSLTRLLKPDNADISYGYADYPTNTKVHMQMDRRHTGVDFPDKSHWQAFEATFNIKEVNSNKLLLEKGDTLFMLKKY